MSMYKRDEQHVKMVELMSQPQIRKSLQNSSYMRLLREQSLKQIINWEAANNKYHESKVQAAQAEKDAKEQQKQAAMMARAG